MSGFLKNFIKSSAFITSLWVLIPCVAWGLYQLYIAFDNNPYVFIVAGTIVFPSLVYAIHKSKNGGN